MSDTLIAKVTSYDEKALHWFVGALEHGRGNAQPAKVLGVRLGTTDRALRVLAHAATERGILICADNAGYFIPTSPDEVTVAIGRLRSQAFEMLTRAKTLERLARERWPPSGPPEVDQPDQGALF